MRLPPPDLHYDPLTNAHHEPTKDAPATSMHHIDIQHATSTFDMPRQCSTHHVNVRHATSMFDMPHQCLTPPPMWQFMPPCIVRPQCRCLPQWCPIPASFNPQQWCSTQPCLPPLCCRLIPQLYPRIALVFRSHHVHHILPRVFISTSNMDMSTIDHQPTHARFLFS